MYKLIGRALLSLMLLFSASSFAGPFILSGTDADDHGGVSGGVNLTGWLYMQRVLENLAPGVTNGNLNVVNLGSSGGEAQGAATSSFNLSTLSGPGGFSFMNIDGTTALNDYFAGVGTVNINNTAIIMMDSGGNVGGGSSVAERAIFTTNATGIDNFLGGGGALFSQSNGYDWVTALLPALLDPSEFATGISLTTEGMNAFPGLTSAAVSAGPYHNRFEMIGGLTVLGTSNSTGNAIIIGSEGGSVTNPGGPGNVPEPSTIALLGLGLFSMRSFQKRRQSRLS